MSDYIREAIITGVWETFVMTFFASLFSYIVGMPLGVLLYATSKGRLLQNRVVNFIIGAIVGMIWYTKGDRDTAIYIMIGAGVFKFIELTLRIAKL